MSMIKTTSLSQDSTSFTTNPSIELKGNEKDRKFYGFRKGVSADIASVEVTSTIKSIVQEDGTQLSPIEQENILASYQTAQIPRMVLRCIENVKRFLQNPNYTVDTRNVSCLIDPNLKAKEWLKSSLYHALCGVGTSFQHNGRNYHVITASDSITYSGRSAIEISNGTMSINLAGNAAAAAEYDSEPMFLVDQEVLTSAMNEVISTLDMHITSGELTALGIPLKRWVQIEPINVEAGSHKLSAININI